MASMGDMGAGRRMLIVETIEVDPENETVG
jgi:hypothetical protein